MQKLLPRKYKPKWQCRSAREFNLTMRKKLKENYNEIVCGAVKGKMTNALLNSQSLLTLMLTFYIILLKNYKNCNNHIALRRTRIDNEWQQSVANSVNEFNVARKFYYTQK